MEDRRISAESKDEQMGISRERVGPFIHEDLDMLVACFLPGWAKDLTAPLYMLCSDGMNRLILFCAFYKLNCEPRLE